MIAKSLRGLLRKTVELLFYLILEWGRISWCQQRSAVSRGRRRGNVTPGGLGSWSAFRGERVTLHPSPSDRQSHGDTVQRAARERQVQNVKSTWGSGWSPGQQ